MVIKPSIKKKTVDIDFFKGKFRYVLVEEYNESVEENNDDSLEKITKQPDEQRKITFIPTKKKILDNVTWANIIFGIIASLLVIFTAL